MGETLVTTLDQLRSVWSAVDTEVASGRSVGFDTEWSAPTIEHRGKLRPDGLRSEMVGYSLAVQGKPHGKYIPLRHAGWAPPAGFDAEARTRLAKHVGNPAARVWMHNAKGELHTLRNLDVRCTLLDSEIMCWLAGWRLNGKGGLKLKAQAEARLGYRGPSFEDVAKGRAAHELTAEEIAPYAAQDAVLTLALGRAAAERCADLGLTSAFPEEHRAGSQWALDRACIPVSAAMERTGVALDADYLLSAAERCEAELVALEVEFWLLTLTEVMMPTKVRRQAKCEVCLENQRLMPEISLGCCMVPGCVSGFLHFKNGKPKMRVVVEDRPVTLGAHPGNDGQVARWMYEELKWWPKDGVPKTAHGHSVAEEDIRKFTQIPLNPGKAAILRLRYQALRKYATTYTRSLVNLARQSGDGRLHASFRQDGTDTQRYSSSGPNLQNLPKSERLDLPWLKDLPDIRRAFRAAPGRVCVVRDFSQVELRIVAHYSKDPTLLRLYREGGDVHAITMAKVGIQRTPAKTYNFSIIYRITAPRLRVKTALATNDWTRTVAQTQRDIDAWFATYPGVLDMHEELISLAKQRGYAEALTGFKRPLHFPGGRGDWGVANQAVNTPIQGTAGGLIKRVMATLNRKWERHLGKEVWWVAQVHDELIVESLVDCADLVNHDMEVAMAAAAPELLVPLTSSGGVGPSWAEAKD